MIRKMEKLHALLIIGFFALLTSTFNVATAVPATTPHTPIQIIGDAAFTATNGVTSGSGTVADPYIIGNWDISAATHQGITVSGTTLYFIIKNVAVHDGGTTFSGISFNSLPNGQVANSTVTSCKEGLSLNNVSDCTISANTYSGNLEGISIKTSNGVIVTGNMISSSTGDGLALNKSTNIVISQNNVTSNVKGISLLSSSDVIIFSKNNITGNVEGILLQSSSGIIISHNAISENTANGLSISNSTGNTISSNDFKNNFHQVSSDPSVNKWDNGYPIGGNYWSNYAGADTMSGPFQNVTGGDGIIDNAFNIAANNRDNYPLVNLVVIPEFQQSLIILALTMAISFMILMHRKKR